jgi:hypothetical protein
MDKRKEPPRLKDMVYHKICKMIREVGIKWTRRLHSAAVMGQNYWLREIKSVEGQCVTVRHRLASLTLPIVSQNVIHYAVEEFAKIITAHDNDMAQNLITRNFRRQIHEDICANMLKAVLLPCMSTYNIGTTKSDFVQILLIKLLYVIPNIKALIFSSKERLNYMQPFMERIHILTQLQEFVFNFGCTTEIIIELSKYCPHLIKLSVRDSRRVDDECVEHLLKLTHLRALNVADTSVSINGYRALLWGLPQIQDVIWFRPIDPVLRGLTGCLPSVREFVGMVSAAQLLVEKCPNITRLLLHSPTEDISDLGELRSVAEMSIRQSCCIAIRFNALIINLGPNLTKLEMHRVLNINLNELINYCTVLEELSICFCHITCTGKFDGKLPHFINLKELRLKQNKALFDSSSVLPLYVNLNVLHVVGMRQITNASVSQIVTAGGFINLTELVVDHCGNLSMETALLLMDSCPNLTKFGNINSWPGVSNEELATLVNFFRHNNLSLNVC